MVLPYSLHTTRQVGYLQCISYASEKSAGNPDVTLYDHVKVHLKIKDIWIQQVYLHDYTVPLNKLSEQEISSWNKTTSESWKDIDPYSSLEDVGNTTLDEIVDSNKKAMNKSNSEGDSDVDCIQSCLKKRMPIRYRTGRPIRAASQNICYADLGTHSPRHGSLKKAEHKPRVLSMPSKSQIASQGHKSIAPMRAHIIKIKHKKALKAETDGESDSATEPVDDTNNPGNVAVSSDDDVPLSVLKKHLSTENTPTPKRKHVFVIRQVGIHKHQRKRTCTCPVCKIQFANQGTLNRHYHENHDRVKCKRCHMVFTMPSTLYCHMYTHMTL